MASENISFSAEQKAILTGQAAVPGRASGPAFIYSVAAGFMPAPGASVKDAATASVSIKDTPTARDPAMEEAALAAALTATRAELEALAAETEAAASPDEAAIFSAQEVWLDDPRLLTAARQGIAQGKNAAAAWWESIAQAAAQLRAQGEEPWPSRASDLEDVGRRVWRRLAGQRKDELESVRKGEIVLADDLVASQILTIARRGALGIGLAHGSLNSHVVILARALGIPAVIGLGEGITQVPTGTPLFLDGETGLLTLCPSAEDIASGQMHPREAASSRVASYAAITTDGRRLAIMANIGSLAGADHAIAQGADGIGLLRTELLYLGRETLPDEAEQVATYAAILEKLAGKPLTIRTLDVSSDKPIPALALRAERNPALGVRGLRASLRQPAVLLTQLRAILRVAAHFAESRDAACRVSTLRLMFPMVSTSEEWRQARALVDEAARQLAAQGLSPPAIPVGMMIEVPAAALLADLFAQEADFFSLGSNDLTQYLMAADRDNPALLSLADGLQPALLRLLHSVIQAAHRAGKGVALCGELAADPAALAILIGLDLDELSMDAAAIPTTRERISRISWAEARRLAEECLSLTSPAEVRTRVKGAYH